MGRQIVKQPNGKYAIWSSILDNFVLYDCTREDLTKEFVKNTEVLKSESIDEILAKLELGEKPYHQCTMTLEEMFKTIEKVHGIEEASFLRRKVRGE